mmetsp:Transcript_5283/g.9148  ORF Transcript_5283/g.9148 Transcript_5283/m.9148 type:complete len:264 (+) Transcript_5283:2240-3031(+)
MEVFALHHLVRVNGQVVAEVVEAQLSVGQIHHVTFVSLLSVRYLHGGLHQSNAESQEAQDLPDVLRVAARQVVVGCDHVDAALVLERCQEGRQQRHDGLPLTCLHLRKPLLVQHQATQQLHIEVPQLQHSPNRLPQGGEGFVHRLVIEAGGLNPLSQFFGLRTQLIIVHLFEFLLQFVDGFHLLGQGLDELFIFLFQISFHFLLGLLNDISCLQSNQRTVRTTIATSASSRRGGNCSQAHRTSGTKGCTRDTLLGRKLQRACT